MWLHQSISLSGFKEHTAWTHYLTLNKNPSADVSWTNAPLARPLNEIMRNYPVWFVRRKMNPSDHIQRAFEVMNPALPLILNFSCCFQSIFSIICILCCFFWREPDSFKVSKKCFNQTLLGELKVFAIQLPKHWFVVCIFALLFHFHLWIQ